MTHFNERFEEYLDEESGMMKSFLHFVEENDKIRSSYMMGDKESLYQETQNIYRLLTHQNDITHFYFIKPDGQVFLRVHEYERDTDFVERFTFLKAKETGKTFSGIEFGLKKNYTLRVVSPWIVDGELIGYIELGKEIDRILHSLSEHLHLEIFFAVDDNEYIDVPKVAKTLFEQSPKIEGHHVVYSTKTPNSDVLDFFDKNKSYEWLELNEEHYIGYTKSLKDVSKKELGKILFLVNVSKEYKELKSYIKDFSYIMLLGTFLILAVAYLYIVRQQNRLNDTLEVLEEETKKVNQQYREIKSLLSLFDKGNAVLFQWKNDDKWSIDYASVNVTNLLGYTQDEFLNKNKLFLECIHRDDVQQLIDEIEELKANNGDYYQHAPYRAFTKQGNEKWILDYRVSVKNAEGEISHFLSYMIDITTHEERMQNLKKFIDTQDNIVILSDGIEISFVNQKFLDFFKYETLESFKEDHKCLCEFFLKNDRFFHLGKLSEDENWIDVIESLPYSKRIVSLKGNTVEHIFAVSVNTFDEKLKIVSFSDISQTMDDYMQLEEKSLHDHLTNAYNREYFEQNFQVIPHRYLNSSERLGVAILDIDHFKLVNDTFGHDVGDNVLIEFVDLIQQNIRKDDILIRWGGEEFLLVLPIKTEEDLFKILEQLRETIAEHHFRVVGSKTCSIGATLYQENESIKATVNRADQGLYKAKATGRNRIQID